jgi:hypothetical protein
VIRYAYLWWNEARVGRDDGVKDRPCGIVLTRQTKQGHTMVYLLPITHTPPLHEHWRFSSGNWRCVPDSRQPTTSDRTTSAPALLRFCMI